jgi:hypothetical protein
MYPGRVRPLLCCAIVAVTLAAPARAADYYVQNGGNDAADGLSGNAWATLGHAADVVNPGDTVHVQDGSYQGFYLSRSGTPGNPITFVADGSGAQITADNGTTPDGINVEGAAYVIIDGFIVNNRTRAGIRVAVSQFVTVRNCTTGYNGHWGIFSGFADDFTIEFNEAHHSQVEHGIYVSNSGDRPVIRGNLVHDNYANGIHMNGDISEGGDGLISNALVERNVIYGNGAGGGSAINMDGVTDSVIRNNLIYDNHASGISLYHIDAAAGSTGNLVINNTIVNAADGRWCININSDSSANTVRNNILYNYHSFRGVITIDASSRAGFASDYNTVMSRFSTDGGDTVIDLPSWQALGYDLHSFVATPAQLFLVEGSDFHLRTGSPAIDAGTSVGAPNDDVDGNPRPVGAGVDIGAYEQQLLLCGNGAVDPGEQCGEPGLTCADQCTSCVSCICALTQPVCGDGVVCGDEQCEADADCGAGRVCRSCQCINTPTCESGIVMQKPLLRLRGSPFALRLQGQAVIPKPWQAVDPLANGVHISVDAVNGSGGLNVIVPGGAFSGGVGWTENRGHSRWTYTDRSGSHGGITRVIITDRSRTTDGLIHWFVRGRGGSVGLPDVTQVRTAVVVGDALECASLQWNPPSGSRPRCAATATRLRCR